MIVELHTDGKLEGRPLFLAKGLSTLVELDGLAEWKGKSMAGTQLLFTGQCTPENPLVGHLKPGASLQELQELCDEYGILLQVRDEP